MSIGNHFLPYPWPIHPHPLSTLRAWYTRARLLLYRLYITLLLTELLVTWWPTGWAARDLMTHRLLVMQTKAFKYIDTVKQLVALHLWKHFAVTLTNPLSRLSRIIFHSVYVLCHRECTRGGFCNFMHLKPISRELRRKLYGRQKKYVLWFFF